MHITIFLLWTFGGCILVTSDQFPVVKIETGFVSGILSKTWNGRTIYNFQGIPYAAPPVGELRFQVKFINHYIIFINLSIFVYINHKLNDSDTYLLYTGGSTGRALVRSMERIGTRKSMYPIRSQELRS